MPPLGVSAKHVKKCERFLFAYNLIALEQGVHTRTLWMAYIIIIIIVCGGTIHSPNNQQATENMQMQRT